MMGLVASVSTYKNSGKHTAKTTREAMTNGWDPMGGGGQERMWWLAIIVPTI